MNINIIQEIIGHLDAIDLLSFRLLSKSVKDLAEMRLADIMASRLAIYKSSEDFVSITIRNSIGLVPIKGYIIKRLVSNGAFNAVYKINLYTCIIWYVISVRR